MKKNMLGSLAKGLIFVISAPAGTGKTTLVSRLIREEECVARSISYTTRLPRPGEKNGIDYHFISVEEFKYKIEQGHFLEHVFLFGHYYGTCRKTIEELQNDGKHVVLVIDTQGMEALRNQISVVSIFITPPSFEELKRRLTSRNTETLENLNQRLQRATEEIACCIYYDYHIVNEDLELTYQKLKSIVVAEELKIR